MTTPNLETKVDEFLAQKRIAVAGVSRNNSHHPAANLIYRRLKDTGHDVFAVNPHMQTFEGDRCYSDLRSIPGGVDGVVIVTRPQIAERIVDSHATLLTSSTSRGRESGPWSPAREARYG